ncbi:aminoacyl-tRNA hydrolase [Psychroflexus maritimus]|nr:aminoacyl-tRNA hydrolase [Psychroflexus maritimus]
MKKFLIVGLGNPGADYVNTRHNIGFKIINQLAEEFEVDFQERRYAKIAEASIKGKKLFLLKPNTFMNLSGKACKYWLEKEKISIENMLVITDDLNLDFGTFRLKMKGSDGGHNGLKSIQQEINTNQYPRFRFGIGDQFSKGKQVNYVLGKWGDHEKEFMPERLEKAKALVKSFCLAGPSITMNEFNGK